MVNPIPDKTWACKSTDVKPTENVPDKQCIIETDTRKMFIFEAEDKQWYPL